MKQTESNPLKITLSLVLFLSGSNLLAWSPTTYQAIGLNAVKLMPAHFKDILVKRQAILFKGINSSASFEKDELIEMIQQTAESLKKKLKTKVNFNEVLFEYGVLAKMISDLNDPTAFAKEVTNLKEEFQTLVAAKIAKIPVVFYGYNENLLARKDLKSYLEGSFERSQKYKDKLVSSYLSQGQASFAQSDDRSPAFGIAALAYSHAISDVANVWLYIWKETNGDTSRTPFYKGSRVKGQEPKIKGNESTVNGD